MGILSYSRFDLVLCSGCAGVVKTSVNLDKPNLEVKSLNVDACIYLLHSIGMFHRLLILILKNIVTKISKYINITKFIPTPYFPRTMNRKEGSWLMAHGSGTPIHSSRLAFGHNSMIFLELSLIWPAILIDLRAPSCIR